MTQNVSKARNPTGKCSQRSNQKSVYLYTSLILEVFLQPQPSPSGGPEIECRFNPSSLASFFHPEALFIFDKVYRPDKYQQPVSVKKMSLS